MTKEKYGSTHSFCSKFKTYKRVLGIWLCKLMFRPFLNIQVQVSLSNVQPSDPYNSTASTVAVKKNIFTLHDRVDIHTLFVLLKAFHTQAFLIFIFCPVDCTQESKNLKSFSSLKIFPSIVPCNYYYYYYYYHYYYYFFWSGFVYLAWIWWQGPGVFYDYCWFFWEHFLE